VAAPGAGDPRGSNADLAALPANLAKLSLSQATIILPHDAALEALKILSERGRRLESWEGWVRMRDGGRAKSLTHGGSFALPRDAARAAEVARAGIDRSQARWNRDPEYPGAELYFGLIFSDS
jgi:hypothetical protein